MMRRCKSSCNCNMVAKRGRISAKRINKNTSIHRCYWRLSQHFLFVLLFSLVYYQRTSIACRICDEENGAVLDRNAVIEPIQGYEFINNCGTLQDLVPLVISSDADLCGELQNTLSSICGCPRELAGGAAPCSLCGNNINFNAGAAVSLQPSDVEVVAPGLAMIVEQFSPTCQLLGAYLGSMPLESEECSVLTNAQQTPALVQSQCACCGECDSLNSGLAENAETETNKQTCQICPNKPGDTYRAPDRDVTDIIDELGFNFLFAPENDNIVSQNINKTTAITTTNQLTKTTITCSDIADTIAGLDSDNAFCNRFLVQVLAGYCDCPFRDEPEELSCAEYIVPTYCETSESNFQPDLELPFLADVFLYGGVSDSGFPFENPTCQEVVWFLHAFPEDGPECYVGSQFAYVCGCGVRQYLGTETRSQQAWLAWLPRLTGLLSLIGSSCILRDLFQKKKRPGRIRTHHNPDASSSSRRRISVGDFMDGLTILQQIVLGMSIFDICSSIALMFSTLPIPKYETFDHAETEEGYVVPPVPSGIYGAMGNEGTCKAQGFFIQLGLTSAFYNMALSIYYFLVIKYGVRESRLQKHRLWFHIPALLVGFSLAFAGIPFYDAVYMICIVPPRVDYASLLDINDTQMSNALAAFLPFETNIVITFFTIVPIMIVFVVGTCSLALVYLHVWKQDRAANRWRMSRGRNNALSSAVFWQFVFYTLSFLLSWPIYFAANFDAAENYDNYNFWVALLILFPLQGFWNAAVYFRPRLMEAIRKRQTVRKRKKEQLQRGQQEQKRVALPKSSVTGRSSTGTGSTNESVRTYTERTEGISASVDGSLNSPQLPLQMPMESSENQESVQIGSSKFRVSANKNKDDTEAAKVVRLDLATDSEPEEEDDVAATKHKDDKSKKSKSKRSSDGRKAKKSKSKSEKANGSSLFNTDPNDVVKESHNHDKNVVDETEREQLTSTERDRSKSNRSSNASIDMSGHLTISDNKTKDISTVEQQDQTAPNDKEIVTEAASKETKPKSRDKKSKRKGKSKKAKARKDTSTAGDVLPKGSSYELGKQRKYEHPSEEIVFLSNASICTDAV